MGVWVSIKWLETARRRKEKKSYKTYETYKYKKGAIITLYTKYI